MRKRVLSLAVALALVLALPAAAFADEEVDESLGSVGDEPAVGVASDAVLEEGITVSAEGNAAVIDGCAFALDNFERANAGSNRAIEDTYYGYAYYRAQAGEVAMVVTLTDCVVYVPEDAAQQYDLATAEGQANLQKYLVALDDVNAHGGAVVYDTATWHFITQEEYTTNGVTFKFNQQVGDGTYCFIIGEDGSDITKTENEHYTKLTHATFATVVAAEDAVLAEEPTFWEAAGNFMSRLDWSPLWVSLRTTLVSIVFIFVLGLAAAYFCLHISPRARDIADTIFTIPMVLPPTVCGFLLLLLLGRNTALGRFFIDIGFPLIFSWPATVIAAVVVAFPLMYRNARGAFENLDPNMLDAARTLGWKESRIFFQLMLPLSWSSIAAGAVLSFARALGEFGATLFLAGNYLGITRTIPIAIYFEWMNGNTDIALFWTGIIVLVSFIVILFINLWSQHTTRYRKGAIEE